MRSITMIGPAMIEHAMPCRASRITVLRALLFALAAGVAAMAQTPSAPAAGPSNGKVAVIAIQDAILQTKDGQKALADMQAKFNPIRQKLEAKRTEIARNEDALRKGQSTMSQEAQEKLTRDVDSQTKSLNRDTDDANADLQQENQRLMNSLGGKMMAVINKYATDKGFVLVLDVSGQNTPVLWASNTIEITRDIIAAYDANTSTPSAAAPPAANSPITKKPTPSGIANPKVSTPQ